MVKKVYIIKKMLQHEESNKLLLNFMKLLFSFIKILSLKLFFLKIHPPPAEKSQRLSLRIFTKMSILECLTTSVVANLAVEKLLNNSSLISLVPIDSIQISLTRDSLFFWC